MKATLGTLTKGPSTENHTHISRNKIKDGGVMESDSKKIN